MALKLRRAGTLAALVVLLVLAATLLGLSYSELGVTADVAASPVALTLPDAWVVPQSVADDAARLAATRFDGGSARYKDFFKQLVATYAESRDKDFVILFNPGGWGLSPIERSPGWRSILDGMGSELGSMGYSSVLLDYRRTSETARGRVKELVEMVADYPSKATELASRVEFLTDHIPDLKVIIAGESNGTVIADSVMDKLRDNPKVYCIQTGPPFWERPAAVLRTLVLRSNGSTRDSFSDGDVFRLVWANVKGLLKLSPVESSGTILSYFRAPGHDYSWQYPRVAGQIITFLEDNFGERRG